MGPIGEVERIAEFYARARAIEGEAAVRCREFAEHAGELGAEDVADMFATLASRHARSLEMLGPGSLSPALSQDGHGWLRERSIVQTDQSDVVRLLTPYQMLYVALHAEQAAQDVVVELHGFLSDPDVREVALRLAQERDAHIALIERNLSCASRPIDWERDFGRVPASIC